MENKFNTVICWQMGKISQGKNLIGDFKVTTPKNPLINNQGVTSIKNITNYPGLSWNTNLQLNFHFDTQLNLILGSLFFPDAQTSNLWLTLCTDPNK